MAVANTLELVVNARGISPQLFGAEAETMLREVDNVLILACGTSYHAGLVARYWLEGARGHPLQRRDRERVPLPRIGAEPEDAGRDDLAVGRDRRYARRAAAREVARTGAHAHDLQRAGVRAGAPVEAALSHARRPGDRRRLDQGLHHPARRARAAHDDAREAPRAARPKRAKRSSCTRCGTCRRADARARRRSRRSRSGRSSSRSARTRSSSAAASTTRSRWKGRSS